MDSAMRILWNRQRFKSNNKNGFTYLRLLGVDGVGTLC